MKYLLDTSVFLWSLCAENKLNRKAHDVLSSKDSELYLSAASSWEIAIKFALGSLLLPNQPSQFVPEAMRALVVRSLDISHSHALAAGELPQHHRDPFDRMLIAQAQLENMVLLTGDRAILNYEAKTLFCGK